MSIVVAFLIGAAVAFISAVLSDLVRAAWRRRKERRSAAKISGTPVEALADVPKASEVDHGSVDLGLCDGWAETEPEPEAEDGGSEGAEPVSVLGPVVVVPVERLVRAREESARLAASVGSEDFKLATSSRLQDLWLGVLGAALEELNEALGTRSEREK